MGCHQQVMAVSRLDEVAAALERDSLHPIARAFDGRDAGLGVAPHMLKLAGTAERLQPMGLCDVKLEPLEGGAHAAQV